LGFGSSKSPQRDQADALPGGLAELELGVEYPAEVDDPDEHRDEQRHDYGHLDGSRTALTTRSWKAKADDRYPIRPCSINRDHGGTSLSLHQEMAVRTI